MNHSQQEIINAVTVIKDVCRDNAECFNCPFYDEENEVCVIGDMSPADWQPTKPEVPRTWRAL